MQAMYTSAWMFDGSGRIYSECTIPATRFALDHWIKTLPQPWSAAMEAMFTGWIYDHLKPHAAALKVARTRSCSGPSPPRKRKMIVLTPTRFMAVRLRNLTTLHRTYSQPLAPCSVSRACSRARRNSVRCLLRAFALCASRQPGQKRSKKTASSSPLRFSNPA